MKLYIYESTWDDGLTIFKTVEELIYCLKNDSDTEPTFLGEPDDHVIIDGTKEIKKMTDEEIASELKNRREIDILYYFHKELCLDAKIYVEDVEGIQLCSQ